MGGERDRGDDARDGAGAPTTDRAAAKAQRKAEKQRRVEERRRRWARAEPAAVAPEAPDGQPVATGTPDESSEKPKSSEADVPAGFTAGSVAGSTTDAASSPISPAPTAASATSSTSHDDAPAGTTAVLTREDAVPDEAGKAKKPKKDKKAKKEKPAKGSAAAGSDDAAPTTAAPVVPARGPTALWLLVLAAHPRQAVLTAAAFAGAAALAGRPLEQVGLLAAMVLVGQTMLGWHNDLVDRDRDAVVLARHRDAADGEAGRRPRRKPLAEGRLEPGSVWYAFAVAALLLVPVGVSNGVTAGVTYLVVVAIGMVGNISLRHGWLSPVPWAASFALYPAVLSYAGPVGGPEGLPPNPALVGLAAALGVVVHVLRALPGLVDDNRDGLRHLPLQLALKVGAPRLLGLAGVVAAGLVIALLTTASQQGLVR